MRGWSTRVSKDLFTEIYRKHTALEHTVRGLEHNEYAFMHSGTAVPAHTAGEGVFYWDTDSDDLYVNSDGATAWQFIAGASGAASHQVLSSTHLDSAAAAVARGALITGQGTATARWTRLVHPGTAGWALTTDGDDAMWDATPTWTDSHTWDKGADDSPKTVYITGSDDSFEFFAENNATPGDSDFVVKLPAADDGSKFIWRDSGDVDVAYVDADGNTTQRGEWHLFGVDDTLGAHLGVYGDAAGSDGGEILLFLAGSYDAVFQHWLIDVYRDDLRILRSDVAVTNTFTAEGQLQLSATGGTGGLLIGGDAQWYRAAADLMQTPDDLHCEAYQTDEKVRAQLVASHTAMGQTHGLGGMVGITTVAALMTTVTVT